MSASGITCSLGIQSPSLSHIVLPSSVVHTSPSLSPIHSNVWVVRGGQNPPCFAGSTIILVRVLVPVPQVAEHGVNSDHVQVQLTAKIQWG